MASQKISHWDVQYLLKLICIQFCRMPGLGVLLFLTDFSFFFPLPNFNLSKFSPSVPDIGKEVSAGRHARLKETPEPPTRNPRMVHTPNLETADRGWARETRKDSISRLPRQEVRGLLLQRHPWRSKESWFYFFSLPPWQGRLLPRLPGEDRALPPSLSLSLSQFSSIIPIPEDALPSHGGL